MIERSVWNDGNKIIDALTKIKNSDLFSHYHFPFVKPFGASCAFVCKKSRLNVTADNSFKIFMTVVFRIDKLLLSIKFQYPILQLIGGCCNQKGVSC